MKVIIFGASGMVGQGVLRECELDPDITAIRLVGRSASGKLGAKTDEVVHSDLWDYRTITSQLSGFDATFFCLGTPSAGKSEAEYARVTYDLTLAAAAALAKVNPSMTFVYVSGDGADSTEQGRVMWARIRGKTENALQRLPFKAVYVFRPGVIQPLHGIQSKTRLYRVTYRLGRPLLPWLRAAFPNSITTTECLGRAMIAVAKRGYERTILTAKDFEILGGKS
jgi:uncharacterized protein YbjT (DUF2867 family)